MPRWSRFDQAADRRLVKGLHEQDDDALATLYDIYAERLYDYSMSLVENPKSASDVVHDTFIDAYRRAPRLRDRERLRPWLYGAVRRRSLQRNRGIRALSWGWISDTADAIDPATELSYDRIRELLDSTFGGLDLADQEMLFLALRHDLDGTDLAATLGIPARRVQSRLARARAQVDDQVSTVVLVNGRDEAAEQPDRLTAAALLNGPSTPVLPAALRHRVLHTGSDPELAGYRAVIAAKGGTLTSEGLPRQPDAPSGLVRRVVLAATGVVGTLTAATIALSMVGSEMDGPPTRWPFNPKHSPAISPTPVESSRSTRPGDDSSGQRPPGQPAPRPLIGPHGQGEGGGGGGGGPAGGIPSPSTSGSLVVSPAAIRFESSGDDAYIHLTSKDGQITWRATESARRISLSAQSGTIRAGGKDTIKVHLDRGLAQPSGQTTVVVTDQRDRSHVVTVSWPFSLL